MMAGHGKNFIFIVGNDQPIVKSRRKEGSKEGLRYAGSFPFDDVCAVVAQPRKGVLVSILKLYDLLNTFCALAGWFSHHPIDRSR